MTFKNALQKKKFVVTSEVQVSIGDEESEGMMEDMDQSKGAEKKKGLSALDLEGIVGDTIKTCSLLQKNNLNAIFQTSTRDKNRYKLQKDLMLAHEAGVENLLVFTEDYRISGDTLQESMFFHVDSGKLGSVMDHLRQGITIEKKEIDGPVDFLMGCGVEIPWGKNMPKRGLEEMEDMMNTGAGYFLTTPIFDIDLFSRFMRQVEPFGVPVIAEVMILRTAGMGKFLNRHFKPGLVPEWVIGKLAGASDKQDASMGLFADIIQSLKDICHGVHIVTIGGVDNMVQYLEAAKLR